MAAVRLVNVPRWALTLAACVLGRLSIALDSLPEESLAPTSAITSSVQGLLIYYYQVRTLVLATLVWG